MAIPGADGRAGMATLIAHGDWISLRFATTWFRDSPLTRGLCFCESETEMEVTATFKYKKADLAREGYDPLSTSDPRFTSTTRR